MKRQVFRGCMYGVLWVGALFGEEDPVQVAPSQQEIAQEEEVLLFEEEGLEEDEDEAL